MLAKLILKPVYVGKNANLLALSNNVDLCIVNESCYHMGKEIHWSWVQVKKMFYLGKLWYFDC